MPTFCRHNRFVERCPICSKTLVPEQEPKSRPSRSSAATRPRTSGRPKRAGEKSQRLHVHRELRAEDDGYRCPLVQGMRSSQDATRLADEIAFSSARLKTLSQTPPGLYEEVMTQADLEQASWMCFLIAYISPLQGEDPYRGIELALERTGDWSSDAPVDLEDVPLGPRSSHDPAKGSDTLAAYRRWATQATSQAHGFSGEPDWSSERRFERVFERLALPGFARSGRFDLLLSMGALGLYELRADSLHLAGATGRASEDPTTVAAKRVFGIGDVMNLERRCARLAEELQISVGVLDLALSNWGGGERVTLGVPADICDSEVLERAHVALEL
jgi:Alpha-glutamyl/putrescinyl thymine pyrophosphorylase clade 3